MSSIHDLEPPPFFNPKLSARFARYSTHFLIFVSS